MFSLRYLRSRATTLSQLALLSIFFFFNDTATTEIYTLSLHDALPICPGRSAGAPPSVRYRTRPPSRRGCAPRSEEHTSELQSQSNLVCRLLLEKKKRPFQAESPSLPPANVAAGRLTALRPARTRATRR